MNNQAIVAKIDEVIAIPGADKIQIAKVLGETCIVSKDLEVGFVGILFPEGLQLSEEYCRENNLYRDKSYNKDPEKVGFFENTRRVRAQPFLKIRSTSYFASLDSVAYAGKLDATVGYSFDKIGDKEICRKYYSKETLERIAKAQRQGNKVKVQEYPFFLKHVDSAHFKHSANLIEKGSLISICEKVHGTSARMSHTIVNIEHGKLKTFINKLADKWWGGEVFPTQAYDYVVGTRNVVLANGDKSGFHGSEQFRFDVMESVKPYLKKGYTLYGDIAAFANGKPIMAVHNSKALKDKEFTKKYGENIIYRYGCKESEYRFHVYRVTMLLESGETVDMTQAQLEQFCKETGLLPPFEVHPSFVYDGNVRDLQDLVENLTERADVKTASWIDPTHPSEGVIIREDRGGLTPRFYKSKSYAFRVMEGLSTSEDIEDAS